VKIYISADFEGTSGVTDRGQCFPGNPAFELARRLWIGDINAAIGGLLDGGAEQVVVNEGHAHMNYLLPELLHPKASFISGYVKTDNQMEGIDPSFAGAVIMGHARPGTPGAVLNHAYVLRDVFEIRLNGEPVGELGLNALWAGYHNVPVILVVGDDKYAAEAKGLIPDVETAVVKTGLSQFTAHCLPLEAARAAISRAAKAACERAPRMKPLSVPERLTMEIDFSLTEIARLCSFVPGVEQIAGRTVSFSSRDYRQLQHTRIVCTNLALAVVRDHF
jgi:D-amino peptidase